MFLNGSVRLDEGWSTGSRSHNHREDALNFFYNKLDEFDKIYRLSEDEKGELLKLWQNADGALADAWSRVWRGFAAANKAALSVRYVLNKKRRENDRTAHHEHAERELFIEVKKSLSAAERYFKPSKNKPLAERIEVYGLAAIEYFEQHNSGPAAQMVIENLKRQLSDDLQKKAKVWANPLYFAKLVAVSKWADHTRALVAEMYNKPAALSAPIFKQMANIMTKENTIDSERKAIVNSRGEEIASIEPAKILWVSAIPLLSSITAYYVVTWLLQQVHKQFLMHQKDFRRIVLKGRAYERLAELSGAGTSSDAVDKTRKIISALAGCLFKYRTKDRLGEGNFLSYRYEKAINGKFSVLVIELQPLACPNFVKTLPEGGVLFQEQRRAIPIMRPFPTYGQLKRFYSSQLRFQADLQMEMRDRAKELYTRGGISLSDETLYEFALNSRLPQKLIRPMLDFWVQNDCLTRSDDGLYNIGARELAARKMMEEAGRFEIEGTAAAKRGLEKRRRKMAGDAKGRG